MGVWSSPSAISPAQILHWGNSHLLLGADGAWEAREAASQHPHVRLPSDCEPQLTAPATQLICEDEGAALGLFSPSHLTALPFPDPNPAMAQDPGRHPQFLPCTSWLRIQPGEKAAWPRQTVHWLRDLCKLKFSTNSLTYPRWKTQPRGCYKPCCWSHKGPSCQQKIAGACGASGAGEGLKSRGCTCQRGCGVGAGPALPWGGCSPGSARSVQAQSCVLATRPALGQCPLPKTSLWFGLFGANILACCALLSCSLCPPQGFVLCRGANLQHSFSV